MVGASGAAAIAPAGGRDRAAGLSSAITGCPGRFDTVGRDRVGLARAGRAAACGAAAARGAARDAIVGGGAASAAFAPGLARGASSTARALVLPGSGPSIARSRSRASPIHNAARWTSIDRTTATQMIGIVTTS